MIRHSLPFLALTIAAALVAPPAGAQGFKPIDKAALAQPAPVVDKDADVEAQLWEVRIHDDFASGLGQSVRDHYVRVKVFTDRGRERMAQVDLPFGNRTHISEVDARTIKPDGTIVELKHGEVFERLLVEASGIKVKAKTFAVPAVEPGCLVEYKWREVYSGFTNYVEFPLQRDIPVQLIKYSIKPLSRDWMPYVMSAQSFHAPPLVWDNGRDGYNSITLQNVAAYREEPYMPPENEMRAWMLVYYTERPDEKADKFWRDFGRKLYDDGRSAFSPDGPVRSKTAALIAGAASAEEKLQRLHDFCRESIKHLQDDATMLPAEELAKASEKESRSPRETLAGGVGKDRDIDRLFGAMATAAGFEARMVAAPDRRLSFFDPSFPNAYFLADRFVAVKEDGQKWRYYDPSAPYLPAGSVRWQNEGMQAIVGDPDQARFVTIPSSPAARSAARRTGHFHLDVEGTLEGDVRIEYTGQQGSAEKERLDDLSPEQRLETLRDEIKAHLAGAELTAVTIENVTEPTAPLVFSFHVRVPGYAQRTGKRLFIEPAVFEHGRSALFPTADRRNPICFPYAWSEEDAVTIALPEGYTLDHPDAPGALSGGPTASYATHLRIATQPYELLYDRTFSFGGEAGVAFDTKAYPALKGFFDAVRKLDDHTVTLKQDSAS